ncbi:MAG TPA: hypothetical protein VIL49_05575, partial [Capillimicrobium sp.]
SADDDGGFFRSRVAAYYRAEALRLPRSTRGPRPERGRELPARLEHAGRFTTRARVSRRVVRRGGSVTIRAAVRPTRSQRALVSIEVYRGERQVFQRYFDHAALWRGEARRFRARWSVPPGAPRGRHAVRLGVFSVGFGKLRAWNASAGTVRVR